MRVRCEEEEGEKGTYNDNHDDGKIHQDAEPFQRMNGEEEHRQADDELENAHPDPELGILWDMFLATRPLGSIHCWRLCVGDFVLQPNSKEKLIYYIFLFAFSLLILARKRWKETAVERRIRKGDQARK